MIAVAPLSAPRRRTARANDSGEESVIHVVGDQLDDLTPRLHARRYWRTRDKTRAENALRIVGKAARF
jgi:hypothetical protein